MNEQETLKHLENVAKTWPNGRVVERQLSWQEKYVLGDGAKQYVVEADRPYAGTTVREEVTGRIVRKNQQ